MFQSEEPTHLEERVGKRRAWTAIAGVVLFLASLLLLFEFYHRSTKAPSATTNRPASGPAKPAEAPTISRETVAPETAEAQSLKTPDRSRAEVSSPAASCSSSPLACQPGARPAEASPGSKPLGAENLGTEVVPPALVIEGAPPEAQIFVDDRLTASTGSDGQAKISTLSPGQHRLRVTVNGYQDYEKDIDLLAGRLPASRLNLNSSHRQFCPKRRRLPALSSEQQFLASPSRRFPSSCWSAPSRPTPAGSPGLRLVPTGNDWPRGAQTRPSSCGMCPPGKRPAPSPPRSKKFRPWPSVATDIGWRRRIPSTLSRFGMPRRGGKSARSPAISLWESWAAAGFIR